MVVVRPIREDDIEGFRAAVDRVAREKRFLARIEGPSFEQASRFVLGNLACGNPHFGADADGLVAGWCDVIRQDHLPIYAHSRTLGMGLVPVAAAFAAGMTRVQLTVRADNEAAITLYRRIGFADEGYHRGTDRIDGITYDTRSMALLA